MEPGSATTLARDGRPDPAEGQLPPAHAGGARARRTGGGAAPRQHDRAGDAGDRGELRHLSRGARRGRARPRSRARPALRPLAGRGRRPHGARGRRSPGRGDGRQAAGDLRDRRRGPVRLGRRPRGVRRGARHRGHRAGRPVPRRVRARRTSAPSRGRRPPHRPREEPMERAAQAASSSTRPPSRCGRPSPPGRGSRRGSCRARGRAAGRRHRRRGVRRGVERHRHRHGVRAGRRFAYDAPPPRGARSTPSSSSSRVATADRTVLRFVQSGFSTASDWDNEYDSFDTGWNLFFDNLRATLTHFAGQPVQRAVDGLTSGIGGRRSGRCCYAALGLAACRRSARVTFAPRAAAGHRRRRRGQRGVPRNPLGARSAPHRRRGRGRVRGQRLPLLLRRADRPRTPSRRRGRSG